MPQLLHAIEQTPQPWRDLLALLLYIGFRRGAIEAMRWSDIDFAAGTWTVPRSRSKSKRTVVLPLVGPARKILSRRAAENAKRKPPSEWVFPGNTPSGHIGRPKRAWRALLDRAKLSGLVPHDLRRTIGSHMAMQGESIPTIGRVLGRLDHKSANPYVKWQLEPVRQAVKRVHAVLTSKRSPRKSR